MPKIIKVSKSLNIRGSSVSAEATGFYVPELEIHLDAGFTPEIFIKQFFITHSHMDHTGGLPRILITKPENGENIEIYVPEEIVDTCGLFIKSALDFSKSNVREEGYSYYNVIPVRIGMTYNITTFNNKNLQVEIIKCFHTVPCVGYGFSEERKRLKSEHKSLKGHEIAELKKSGIEVTEKIFIPILLFLGDTNEKIFENASIYNYPIIMIECTYYEDVDLKLAKSNSHMHWKFLSPVILAHPEIKFVVMHPSAKIKISQIRKTYKYDNVIFV
jgi:ribonuclease Z